MGKLNVLVLLALILAPAWMASCSENEDYVEEFVDWQDRNESYFLDVYQRALSDATGTWKVIRCYAFEDSLDLPYYDNIVVEVLEEGTGSGCPLYTDSVLVNYRGRLLPSTSYPEGYVFDESYEGDYNPLTATPAQFYVGDLIDGFTTALQYMHIGDLWRVYIPSQLAYGEYGSSSVPAYSTLIFDIALVAYYRANATVTPWYSRRRGGDAGDGGHWVRE